MEATAIGFDVYGTLVDPLAISAELRRHFGPQADPLAALWREKQLEYTFRRGLMGQYEDFAWCTRQALVHALSLMALKLKDEDREALLARYQALDAFDEVAQALRQLAQKGCQLVAFSNGTERMVRPLLEQAGVLQYLDDVISVDDLQTYKPNPAVYHYLVQRTGGEGSRTWLVSGNPFDIIGARAAGLRAAWVKRREDAIFDPWDEQPDLIVSNLLELVPALR